MDALEWVREHGVVLQSARGPVPNLAERVAGEPIRGSWWGHRSGHEIFAVLTRVLGSPDVIATRLVNGRVTLIHRRDKLRASPINPVAQKAQPTAQPTWQETQTVARSG